VEDSVAGLDGRIQVNDHIVSVNGISLVGVGQKLASQTLSNCAICPETGTVHFVLGRPKSDKTRDLESKEKEESCDDNAIKSKVDDPVTSLKIDANNDGVEQPTTAVDKDLRGTERSSGRELVPPPTTLARSSGEGEFEGRNAIRLSNMSNIKSVQVRIEEMKSVHRLFKMSMWSLVLITSFLTIMESAL